MNQSVIRVVIADDQSLVRQGLRALLQFASDVEVVGEARDGDEAFHLIRQTKPDVVLLDVRMPGASGLEVLEALNHAGSTSAVILLTTFDDPSVARSAAQLGARGYLLKDVSFDQLIAAIREITAGKSRMAVLGDDVARRLKDQPPVEGSDGVPHLTAREEDVLRLLAAGLNNREIADALNMTEGSVKNRVSDILSKLGVRDRTQAVLRAARIGLL